MTDENHEHDHSASPFGGCSKCGEFPVRLSARCHVNAPLIVFATSPCVVEFYCSACRKFVARCALAASVAPPVH